MAFCDDPTHQLGPRDVGRQATDPRCPMTSARAGLAMTGRRTIGIGVIGLGWMGQAHSRSYRRIPTLFPDRTGRARARRLRRRRGAARRRGGRRVASASRRPPTTGGAVVDIHDVDVVVVTAPNMLHVEIVVGRQSPPASTSSARSRSAARPRRPRAPQRRPAPPASSPASGYNYRWAPLVRHARQLIDDGRLGQHHQLPRAASSRCTATIRWACCRGASSQDEGGYGVSSDLLSHSVDLAHFLVGPIAEVVGTQRDVHHRAAAPAARRAGPLRPRRARRPDRAGDQRGLRRPHSSSSPNGVRGTFETSRSIVGPESQIAFERVRHEGRARPGTSSR